MLCDLSLFSFFFLTVIASFILLFFSPTTLNSPTIKEKKSHRNHSCSLSTNEKQLLVFSLLEG